MKYSLLSLNKDNYSTDRVFQETLSLNEYGVDTEVRGKKNIFFDITELSKFDKGTGIQRVTKTLLGILSQSPPLGWAIIPVRGDSNQGLFFQVPEFDKINECLSEANKIEPTSGDIFLSVDLSYNISVSLQNELRRFRTEGVGVYFVVYDLIPLLYPQWFFGTSEWFEGNEYLNLFNHWWSCAISISDGLLCISKSVERDVCNWLNSYPPSREIPLKIDHFYIGSNIDDRIFSTALLPEETNLLAQVRLKTSFLMVGTLEPRKGHALALDAFDQLWKKGLDNLKLVIVGRAGWHVEQLVHRIKTHPRLGIDLIWLSGINDQYLVDIYKNSSVLLALSEAEGFGLPLVEAAHFHLPILARSIPVFREICGDGAFYFKGTNAEDLRESIMRWLNLFKTGKHPNSRTMRILSWEDSLKQLMSSLGKMHGVFFEWGA